MLKIFKSILAPKNYRLNAKCTSYLQQKRFKNSSEIAHKSKHKFVDKDHLLAEVTQLSTHLFKILNDLHFHNIFRLANKKEVLSDLNKRLNLNRSELRSILNYLEANHAEFTPAEKSILYKIIVSLKAINPDPNMYLNVIQKLELDLSNNVSQCNLIDLFNYTEALPFRNLSHISKCDFYQNMALKMSQIVDEAEPARSQLNNVHNSPLVNELNKQWLQDVECPNDLLFVLITLQKFGIFFTNDYKNKLLTKIFDTNYIKRVIDSAEQPIDQKLNVCHWLRLNTFGKNSAVYALYEAFQSAVYAEFVAQLRKNPRQLLDTLSDSYYLFCMEDLIMMRLFDNVHPLYGHLFNKINHTSSTSFLVKQMNTLNKLHNFLQKLSGSNINFRDGFFIEGARHTQILPESLKNFETFISLDQKYAREIKGFAKNKIHKLRDIDDLNVIRNLILNDLATKDSIKHLFEKILLNFDKYYADDSSKLLMILNELSTRNYKFDKRTFNVIFQKFAKQEQIYKIDNLRLVSILINNPEHLHGRFDFAALDSCFLNPKFKFVKILLNNFDYYMSHLGPETNEMVNSYFHKVAESVVKLDQCSHTTFLPIFRIHKHFELKPFVVDLVHLKESLKRNVFSLDTYDLDKNVDKKISKFTNALVQMRNISDLIILNNIYEPRLLEEMTDICLNITYKMRQLEFGPGTSNYFYASDFGKLFDLFNYFDINLMKKSNLIDQAKFRSNINQLEDLHSDLLVDYLKPHQLLNYCFALCSLDMVNLNALHALFPRNSNFEKVIKKIGSPVSLVEFFIKTKKNNFK